MPVIIKPSPDKVGHNNDPFVDDGAALFSTASKAWTIDLPPDELEFMETNKEIGKEGRRIIRTSFDNITRNRVVPYTNGFVKGIIRAFNQDLHLVLRPDDLWLAILSQFSMYINGHGEEMRSFFVEHDNKAKISVDIQPNSISDADLDVVARSFVDRVQDHVIDPELKEWMITSFTTTTPNDTAVASFVMLGSLQHYFEYECIMGCGFPSVTLLGEKLDWEAIVARIGKLERYGEEVSKWARLLLPIAKNMVRSFEEPEATETKDFWLRVCYEAGRDGSGCCATLSGWITAFCFWNEEGRRNYDFTDGDLKKESQFSGIPVKDRCRLVLDEISYPVMSPSAIPSALICVPITVKDFASLTTYQTTIITGHVGVTATKENSTVQPLSGWWMLEDSSEPLDI